MSTKRVRWVLVVLLAWLSLSVPAQENNLPGGDDDMGYGVLWERVFTPLEGPNVPANPVAIAPDALVLDRDLGVVSLDAATGRFERVIPPPEGGFIRPTALTADAMGNVYVADAGCRCLHGWVGDAWQAPFEGFDDNAPSEVISLPDGTLYLSDIAEAGAVVREIGAAGVRDWPLPGTNPRQPQLLLANETLYALTAEGELLRLQSQPEGEQEAGFSRVQTLPLGGVNVIDASLTAAGELAVALDQGVRGYDAEGNLIGTFTTERVQGLTWEGTRLIFVTDSELDGQVIALSAAVEDGRVGRVELVAGAVVEGELTAASPTQTWRYAAPSAQTITLFVEELEPAQTDLTARLLAPDGSELGMTQPFALLNTNPFIPPAAERLTVSLPAGGTYPIQVSASQLPLRYGLGLLPQRTINPSAEAITLTSELNAVIASERFVLEARAGQRLTVTMRALSGNLDPLLLLYDAANDQRIAENDDAPNLGRNAQLREVELPVNGPYLLEASRFDGVGRYALTVTLSN